ncbi:MAG: hypothetical protein FWF35_04595 [Elusimicrobia bacterium]|nr:hypothetical protein [Elusimicrobiota bacterium]
MQTQIFKKLYAVTDIVGDSFNVFFKNIVNLILFQLIYVAAVIVCSAPFWIYFVLTKAPLFNAVPKNLPTEVARQMDLEVFNIILRDPYMWLFFAVALILLIAAAFWRIAAVSAYLESKFLGTPLGIWESFKKTYARVTPFFLTLFAVFLIIYAVPLVFGGGAVFAFTASQPAVGALCMLAAFFTLIAAWFVFMTVLPLPQVLALKGKNYTDAVKYAWRLVRGGYWPTIGFFLLVMLVMFAFVIAAMFVQWIVYFIGIILAILASLVPFLGIIVMVLLTLVVLVIQMTPQCYIEVPLVMYYLNREAVKGDGIGPVADAARAAQADQTPQQPDTRNVVQLEPPPPQN